MAKADFRVVKAPNGSPVSRLYRTDAGGTDILAGEWVVQDGTNGEYVDRADNGASNAQTWVGVAATDSTHTATADGIVYVYDDPEYTFRGQATTSSNLASTVRNTQVTLDVTSDVQTVDEDDTTNGTLIIRDYDADAGTVDVQMAKDDHLTKG